MAFPAFNQGAVKSTTQTRDSYLNPVLGSTQNNDAMATYFTPAELAARKEEDRRFTNPTFMEGVSDTLSDLDFSSMGLGAISDMFKPSKGGGSSPILDFGNLAIDSFSTWDKYKTNKLNRALVNQQIANNNTIMADNAWNKNKLGTGFGVANYGS